MSQCHKVRRESGFTLIETMVAIVVLTIGLMSVAALMGQMVTSSADSRYFSIASVLASEKLEDLNRFPSNDPNVAAGGNLAGTPAGYSDTVQISTGSGAITETTNGITVTHAPDGTVTTVAGAAPAPTADTLTFARNWVIEKDAPVPGVRRITVLVTLTSKGLGPSKPVTFQTSTVRP
ncbi:MAG TPA: prepilin-type N-terminal cleavage/methylation domain-containing protein [Candidatus Acidoferrum sp.]|jgi:prepilin-type N-terminal cleavage/methylation domain-containing protein